jgi:predicted GNAT family acetyltransferase/glutaredoxin
MITLYQAEWCPFSSAVREVLTELGIDFVARQVEPWPQDRARLREATGTDQIPVLVTEAGDVHRGTRAIFQHLATLESWEHAAAHRRRFADHLPARESDVPGQLLERFPVEPRGPALDESPGPVRIADAPERHRYEIFVGGELVGHAVYRKRNRRIVFTHTEIAPSCEGRGLGTALARAALDDARAQGLQVTPLCPFIAHIVATDPAYADLRS